MKIEITIKKISNGFIVSDGERDYYRESLSELVRLLTSDGIREAEKNFKESDLEGETFYFRLETNILPEPTPSDEDVIIIFKDEL